MTKRLLPILVAIALGFSTPLIAQTEDQPQQQPTVESPTAEAPADAPGVSNVDEETSGTDESRELPRTASPLPLLALLGLSSGAAAFGLRRRR